MSKHASVFIRSPHNYDVDEASYVSGQFNDEPSLAQQSFCEECDINTIVRRFGLTGELPSGPVLPQFGDFSGIGDYQAALDVVSQAQEAFLRVPAHIRATFNHDPGAFVDFCSDSANLPQIRAMGLAPVLSEPAEPVAPLATGSDG
ncbi:MAG: internal scaffolding protein [Microvirus sp.]|nr:MAG: internal scaffolding protein [Microvirus sp.]